MKEKIQNIINNPQLVKLIGIYAAAVIFLLIILWSLVAFSQQITSKNSSEITPSPTNTSLVPPPTYPPVPTNDTAIHKELSVVSTSPTNNQTAVPVSLNNIILTFDQDVSVPDVPLAISPTIHYSINSEGKSIIITPQEQLDPGTTYSVVLRLYKAGGQINYYSLNFSVIGPTLTPMPTDSFNQQQENDQQRQAAPDVYLSNYTPYSGSDFSISSNYNLPLHHYQFAVTLSGSDQTQAKQDFLSWLKTLGYTDQEIQSLDITYQ